MSLAACIPYLCISVCQPWAWAIVQGHKRIANRVFGCCDQLPRVMLIHAGKSEREMVGGMQRLRDRAMVMGVAEAVPSGPGELRFGCIIGCAVLMGCTHGAAEALRMAGGLAQRGFMERGKCYWVFAHPTAFAQPVPWVGQLGVFAVPGRIVQDQVPGVL